MEKVHQKVNQGAKKRDELGVTEGQATMQETMQAMMQGNDVAVGNDGC